MDGPSRRPSEQHRNEGSRAQRDPHVGGPSFAYFSWASKKSEAPGGAQPKLTNNRVKLQDAERKVHRIANPPPFAQLDKYDDRVNPSRKASRYCVRSRAVSLALATLSR